MIVITTNNIEGGTIKKYIDAVCVNTVVGTNVFSDFAASFTDFFGGRSGSYKRKMEAIYEEARSELEAKAARIGANAIIGFRVDFDEISGKDKSMFMVSMSGTACVVEYERKQNVLGKEQVSCYAVDEEMEKAEAIRQLNDMTIGKDSVKLLIKTHPQEAVKPLLRIYETYAKNQLDQTVKDVKEILSSYPDGVVDKEVYDRYEESGYSGVICTLIVDCGLFNPEYTLSVCKKNVHSGINLLAASKGYYSRKDLECMKEICAYLDSLPDTGRIERVKAGLLKKEEDMFVCQNGHKNPQDEEFCSKENCGVNMKGLVKDEVAQSMNSIYGSIFYQMQ